MAWIEYHTALRDHWKIKRLADTLKVEYAAALGYVSCLWLWSAEYAPTGDLRRFTDEEIRFAARATSLQLTKKTLNTCGLLTKGQFINDWGHHGLKLLQSKRKANREYMRRKRESGYPQDIERVAIPTIPNHTVPNQIPTKEKQTAGSFSDDQITDLKRQISKTYGSPVMSEFVTVKANEIIQMVRGKKGLKNPMGYAMKIAKTP